MTKPIKLHSKIPTFGLPTKTLKPLSMIWFPMDCHVQILLMTFGQDLRI